MRIQILRMRIQILSPDLLFCSLGDLRLRRRPRPCTRLSRKRHASEPALAVRLSLALVRLSMCGFRRLNGVPDLACPVPGFRCLELPPLRRRPYAPTHAPQADPRDFSPRTCLPDPWTKLLSKAPCAKALSKASHKRLCPRPRTKPLSKASHKAFGQSLAQSLWPRPCTKPLAKELFWEPDLDSQTSFLDISCTNVQVRCATCTNVQVGQRTCTFVQVQK